MSEKRELWATYTNEGKLWLVFESEDRARDEVATSPGWTVVHFVESQPTP